MKYRTVPGKNRETHVLFYTDKLTYNKLHSKTPMPNVWQYCVGGYHMRPKEILCQWVDAFNSADAEAIADLYDDKAINHQVANEPVIGKIAIRKMFEQEFSQAKMVCIVENIFEDGQWAILEWRDPLGLRGCGFFQIVNDRIVFQRGYWDKLSFLKLHNLPIE